MGLDVKSAKEKLELIEELGDLTKDNDGKEFEDNLAKVVAKYSNEPTQENEKKLKQVVEDRVRNISSSIDENDIINKIYSACGLSKPSLNNSVVPKPKAAPKVNDGLTVTPNDPVEQMNMIDKMLGITPVNSDFKKAMHTDGKIISTMLGAGLSTYDFMTYTSTSKLWKVMAFLTIGTTFTAATLTTLAVKSAFDITKAVVKTLNKVFKAQKGTAERSHAKKYKQSIERGTKTADKLVEVLGAEEKEAYEAIKGITELNIEGLDTIHVADIIRENRGTGTEPDDLNQEDGRKRLVSAEEKLKEAKEVQGQKMYDSLEKKVYGGIIGEIAKSDKLDPPPRVEDVKEFLLAAKVDKDGNIVYPNLSTIKEEDIKKLPQEVQNRLKAVLEMPRIQDLTEEQIVKLSGAARVSDDGASLQFGKDELGEDEDLLKISQIFEEHTDLLEDTLDVDEVAADLNGDADKYKQIQMVEREVLALHKLDVAKSIKEQFGLAQQISQRYSQEARENDGVLSKTDTKSKKAVRDVAIAKMDTMRRRGLTGVLKAGDEAQKTVHEKAEGILLKDLLATEKRKSRTLDKQQEIYEDKFDYEQDL